MKGRWRPGKKILRTWLRPPYLDELGNKGFFERISHAQPHVVRRLYLNIAGWPRTTRPIRIAFLSDLHAGSHANDVVRLRGIIEEVAKYEPDLALHGGDFVNMQPFGGGRLAPNTIASVLSHLKAPLGNFAVLGNHDHCYGADEVTKALTVHGIRVLDDAADRISFEGHIIDLIGLPDAHDLSEAGRRLIGGLTKRPTIVLAHDPHYFAYLPPGPHLMLAGHTHGGQISLPLVGVLRNASWAPLRWTYGLIEEGGRLLYVTSGLGTSALPVRIGVPPEYVIVEIAGQ